jgi:3'-5' exoribonuclease
MKNIFVCDLENGQNLIDFFMASNPEVRKGSNNKDYLNISLSDKSGNVNGKKWDLSDDEEMALSIIKTGDIVKVKAQVTEWQGMKQLRILKIRPANDRDELDMADFVKAAPENPVKMYSYIFDTAESIGDADFRKITIKLLTDNREKLLYYPAASRNHHAEFGGLLWHMKRMLQAGKALCSVYKDLSEDLLVTGVIIHDIEKLNEINADENGMASGYSVKGELLGHISQGVTLIDNVSRVLGIPEEKSLMMQHMILSHHYEPDFGSPKKPMFPEAEVLHYLDIMDARLYDMEEALKGVDPGAFSERVRTLENRRVYKPTFLTEQHSPKE